MVPTFERFPEAGFYCGYGVGPHPHVLSLLSPARIMGTGFQRGPGYSKLASPAHCFGSVDIIRDLFLNEMRLKRENTLDFAIVCRLIKEKL